MPVGRSSDCGRRLRLAMVVSLTALAGCDAASAGRAADTAKQSARRLSVSARMVMREELPKEALAYRDSTQGTDGRFVTHGIRVDFDNPKPVAYEIRWRQFERFQEWSVPQRLQLGSPKPNEWNCIVRTFDPCEPGSTPGPVYLTAGSMGEPPRGRLFRYVPRPLEFDGAYKIQIREKPTAGSPETSRDCDLEGFEDEGFSSPANVLTKYVAVDYLDVCRKEKVFANVDDAILSLREGLSRPSSANSPLRRGFAFVKPGGRFANDATASSILKRGLNANADNPVQELVLLGACARSLYNRAFSALWMRFDTKTEGRSMMDVERFHPTPFHLDFKTEVRVLWSKTGTWGCTNGVPNDESIGGVPNYDCTGDVLKPKFSWPITYVGDGTFPPSGIHKAPDTVGNGGHWLVRYFLRRAGERDHP